MLLVLDLLSTVCFASAGALIALRTRLSTFGVLLCAMLTATGGGTLREFLLGSGSLFWMVNPVYVLAVVLAIPIAILLQRAPRAPKPLCRMIDSLATSVFIMVGVLSAFTAGCDLLVVMVMGILTGIGGGLIRQVIFDRRSILRDQTRLLAAAATAVLCAAVVSPESAAVSVVFLLALTHFVLIEFILRPSRKSRLYRRGPLRKAGLL